MFYLDPPVCTQKERTYIQADPTTRCKATNMPSISSNRCQSTEVPCILNTTDCANFQIATNSQVCVPQGE